MNDFLPLGANLPVQIRLVDQRLLHQLLQVRFLRGSFYKLVAAGGHFTAILIFREVLKRVIQLSYQLPYLLDT